LELLTLQGAQILPNILLVWQHLVSELSRRAFGSACGRQCEVLSPAELHVETWIMDAPTASVAHLVFISAIWSLENIANGKIAPASNSKQSTNTSYLPIKA
jgi:hypothetical protein